MNTWFPQMNTWLPQHWQIAFIITVIILVFFGVAFLYHLSRIDVNLKKIMEKLEVKPKSK